MLCAILIKDGKNYIMQDVVLTLKRNNYTDLTLLIEVGYFVPYGLILCVSQLTPSCMPFFMIFIMPVLINEYIQILK